MIDAPRGGTQTSCWGCWHEASRGALAFAALARRCAAFGWRCRSVGLRSITSSTVTATSNPVTAAWHCDATSNPVTPSIVTPSAVAAATWSVASAEHVGLTVINLLDLLLFLLR